MASDDDHGMSTRLSSSARRRIRSHKAVIQDCQGYNAKHEVFCLQQRVAYLKWTICCQVQAAVCGEFHPPGLEQQPETEPAPVKAHETPIVLSSLPPSATFEVQGVPEDNPCSRQIKSLLEELDKFNADLCDQLYSQCSPLVNSMATPTPISPVDNDNGVFEVEMMLTQSSIYEDAVKFSTRAAEDVWRQSGNEDLQCQVASLRRMGFLLCRLGEGGSMAAEEFQIEKKAAKAEIQVWENGDVVICSSDASQSQACARRRGHIQTPSSIVIVDD